MDGVFQCYVFVWRIGKDFCYEEWLGQEVLDFMCVSYYQFVFFRQFVYIEDGDNVFQFLIMLQDGLNVMCGVVVFLINNQWIQLMVGGIQWVNGWVDIQGCDLMVQYYGCI